MAKIPLFQEAVGEINPAYGINTVTVVDKAIPVSITITPSRSDDRLSVVVFHESKGTWEPFTDNRGEILLSSERNNILLADPGIYGLRGYASGPVSAYVDASIPQDVAVITAIRDMTDTIVEALEAIKARMGRVDKYGVMEVATHANSTAQVTASASSEVMRSTYRTPSSGSDLSIFSKVHDPFNQANMGAAHLYNNIQVL